MPTDQQMMAGIMTGLLSFGGLAAGGFVLNAAKHGRIMIYPHLVLAVIHACLASRPWPLSSARLLPVCLHMDLDDAVLVPSCSHLQMQGLIQFQLADVPPSATVKSISMAGHCHSGMGW